MKINTYSNNPPQTPYAPAWDFAIAHSLIPLRIDNLALTCLKNLRFIKIVINWFLVLNYLNKVYIHLN